MAAAQMHHRWVIDSAQYARHESRRGRRHAFETVHGPSTVLVVVDMVPFFCEQNPYCGGILTPVTTVADALRQAGGTVAWVVPGDQPASDRDVEFFGEEVAARYQRSSGGGALSARLWAEVSLGPQDMVVEKFARSAFFPGACDLHEALQSRSIDTVVIAGTVANVCCESSIRDAFTLGYRVIAMADGMAAANDKDLNATLHTVYRSFGDVRPAAEICQLLKAGAP